MKWSSGFACVAVTLVFILSVAGCSNSKGISSNVDTSSIPKNASEIQLFSSNTPDDYIKHIGETLETLGFVVLFPEERKIQTRDRTLGRQLSLTIHVLTDDDTFSPGTIARFTGVIRMRSGSEYLVRRRGRTFASWNTTDDNEAYAFQRLVEYVQQIDHERLVYAVPR